MSDVSDHLSDKSVVLCVQAAKFDAEMLVKAIKYAMDNTNKLKQKLATPKNVANKGQQTVKQLIQQGKGVTNIPITDKNIKSFESIARKYGVDFALKKDNTVSPPKWLVFFKPQDAGAVTAAFTEFAAKQAKRASTKASVHANLAKFTALIKTQVIDKVKDKIIDAFTR